MGVVKQRFNMAAVFTVPDSVDVEPPWQSHKWGFQSPAWLCLFPSHISPYTSPIVKKTEVKIDRDKLEYCLNDTYLSLKQATAFVTHCLVENVLYILLDKSNLTYKVVKLPGNKSIVGSWVQHS